MATTILSRAMTQLAKSRWAKTSNRKKARHMKKMRDAKALKASATT